MRPLSVLVVSHTSELWGAEIQLLETAPVLRSLGVSLTVAAPGPGPFVESWRARGWVAIELGVAHQGGLRRPDGSDRRPGPVAASRQLFETSRAAVTVGRLVRTDGYDIVQAHSLSAAPEVALAARLAVRPCVLDLHDLVRPGLGQHVLRQAARFFSMTMANSLATAELVGRARMTVIHPSVDQGRFYPGPADAAVRSTLCAQPEDPLVAIVGRIDEHKGVDTVVAAVASLPKPWDRVQIVVVGSAYESARYAQVCRQEAERILGRRVRFVGARADVPEILRSIDVLVNASDEEPFGRSLLEAQASATPVVGTAAGGIPEFVEDGVSGLLVPPGDIQALAAAIQRVLGDRDLVDSLRAGEAKVAAAHNAQRTGEAIATMYRSLISH